MEHLLGFRHLAASSRPGAAFSPGQAK